jgi:hypothetical protein
MQISIPITEAAFPYEVGDEISITQHGNRFYACFREEEFNGTQDGEGDCPLLAAADLVLRPWKGWA